MLTRLGEKPLRSSPPKYVLDATPIIHFSKINKIKLVLSICEAYMTREVYRETVEHAEGKPDAATILDAVERGELKVYDVGNRNLLRLLQRHPEIHSGEAETLAAAKELDAFAIIDEAEARAVAKTYGIRIRAGTLFLLFRLLALRKIDIPETEQLLDDLVESGLYVDSHTLIKAKLRMRNGVVSEHQSQI